MHDGFLPAEQSAGFNLIMKLRVGLLVLSLHSSIGCPEHGDVAA
jgi:hypothetical protein